MLSSSGCVLSSLIVMGTMTSLRMLRDILISKKWLNILLHVCRSLVIAIFVSKCVLYTSDHVQQLCFVSSTCIDGLVRNDGDAAPYLFLSSPNSQTKIATSWLLLFFILLGNAAKFRFFCRRTYGAWVHLVSVMETSPFCSWVQWWVKNGWDLWWASLDCVSILSFFHDLTVVVMYCMVYSNVYC